MTNFFYLIETNQSNVLEESTCIHKTTKKKSNHIKKTFN